MSLLLFPVMSGIFRKHNVCMVWVDIGYRRSDYSASIIGYRKPRGDCPSVECAIARRVSTVGDFNRFVVRRNTEPIY